MTHHTLFAVKMRVHQALNADPKRWRKTMDEAMSRPIARCPLCGEEYPIHDEQTCLCGDCGGCEYCCPCRGDTDEEEEEDGTSA